MKEILVATAVYVFIMTAIHYIVMGAFPPYFIFLAFCVIGYHFATVAYDEIYGLGDPPDRAS